ncbi:MAG: hypothetical protein QXP49_04160, partial [Nitrososphaerota archaeon]
ALLQPSVYGFSATACFAGLEEMAGHVNQTHVELVGVRCLEYVEFKPAAVGLLKGSGCPEFFYMSFMTPTVVGGRRSRLWDEGGVCGLLPPSRPMCLGGWPVIGIGL